MNELYKKVLKGVYPEISKNYSKDLASSFSVDPVKSFMGQQNFVPDIASQVKSFTPQFDAVGNALNFPQGASAVSNVNFPNIGSGAKYAFSNPTPCPVPYGILETIKFAGDVCKSCFAL
jgi:hypothetical protein